MNWLLGLFITLGCWLLDVLTSKRFGYNKKRLYEMVDKEFARKQKLKEMYPKEYRS